ncbi:MAG: VOC family protein [Thermoplasmata archaeon]|uniref:VOC family protein n=1 Tax=Candidatus Sysuiplasma superficiale TaxID=2823368 RepID=A0A8J8CF10_9ARCH|nr:VOC family protein [Candidatus Sysuiplasma superficiale]MBX8644832.1 VOC family protein [Candidatus Sysuiplasma superficiale]
MAPLFPQNPANCAIFLLLRLKQIERGSLDDWARRLEEKGVRITHRETWDTGSRSVYFEDPDGNVVELLEQGLWPLKD